MGREVRMVPKNWKHPKYTQDSAPHERYVGRYIPLHYSGYAAHAAEWDEGFRQWGLGFVETYSADRRWKERGEEHAGRYTEWAGARPSPDDYMPDWPDDQRTHFMMYEDTSEGTPISPAFETAEELAEWLASNKASAFGDETATYGQWLATIKAGWAVSAVFENGTLKSGVAAAESFTK